MGTRSAWGPTVATTAGKTAMIDYWVLDYFDPSGTPETKAFADAYQKKYNLPADFTAANSYDWAYIVSEQMKKVGVDDKGDAATRRKALSTALAAPTGFKMKLGSQVKFVNGLPERGAVAIHGDTAGELKITPV
jgi:ABC-type branched-subunit amino acid transport system substrate-binding protein